MPAAAKIAAIVLCFCALIALGPPPDPSAGNEAKTDWMALFGPTQQKRIIERSQHYKLEASTGLYWDFSLQARKAEIQRQIASGTPQSQFKEDELVAFTIIRATPRFTSKAKDRGFDVRGTPTAVTWENGAWTYQMPRGDAHERLDGPSPAFIRAEVVQKLEDGSHLVRVRQTPAMAVDFTVRVVGLPPTADGTHLRNVYAAKSAGVYEYTTVLGATKTVDSYVVKEPDPKDAVRPVTPEELAEAIAKGRAKVPEYRVIEDEVTSTSTGRKFLVIRWDARDATPKPIKPLPESKPAPKPAEVSK